jgi:hypothetical protein
MISIIEREFTNTVTGFPSTVYKSNAVDATICRYLVKENIFFQNTNGVVFNIDQSNNKIYISGGSWTLGGLLDGDTVKLYHNGVTYTQTIVSVTSNTLELNGIDNAILQNDFLQIEGWTGTNRTHANIYINHAFQGAGFTLNSHIDLEKTGFKVDNLTTTGIYNFIQFGNQSGQFRITDVSISNKSASESGGEWEILFTVINSGVYAPQIQDPLQDFHLNFGVQFFRINANPNTAELLIDNYLSNIGWFNMGFNDEPADGLITVPITTLRYNANQSFTVELENVSTDLLGFGASYIPINNSYYKNKPINQSELGMTVETTPTANSPIVGINNFENGTPSWTLEVLGTTFIGSSLTVDLGWEPNFNGFMNDQDGDRLFYVWLKTGNTNHLVFAGQLTKEPTANEEFTPDFFQVTKFDENITIPISNDNKIAVIEDNLAMLVKIPLVQDQVYQSIQSLVYLERLSDNQKVVLASQNFNLANNVYPNGFYVGQMQAQTNNNLSNGSVKNLSTLIFSTPIGVNYLATVNFPFLINWRYWINNASIFPQLYPNQNNDWYNFVQAGFKFYMEVRLLSVDGSYQFAREELVFEDYDSDGKIGCAFTLFKSDGIAVTHVLDEQMTIEVVHTGLTVTPNLSGVNLEFTIEPKENQPRFQVSTEYSETNPNNPLTIISNTIVTDTSTTILAIDTTKLDITGGISITSEIHGLVGADEVLMRYKETFEYLKLPSFGDGTQERCGISCCEVQLKVASSTDASPEKNDKTAIYYRTDGEGGEIEFSVWKDGIEVEAVTMSNSAFDILGRFGQVDWRTILLDHGTGCYEIRYDGTVASIPFSGVFGNYQLLEYTCELVQTQVRVRTYFDKYFKEIDLNFKGTSLFDDVRFEGTFGDMQNKINSDVLMYGDDYQRLINQENRPEYSLKSKLVAPIASRLVMKNLLMATDIFVSEYNPNSADFFPYENVILSNEGSVSLEYSYGTRKRGIEVNFAKKQRNERLFKK